jgi:outer membrane immunogenic protein
MGVSMKKQLFASAALLSLTVFSGSAANAADMAVRNPAYNQTYNAAPVSTWTGCYVGVQGGYGRAGSDELVGHADGGLAGGQIGCNWQTDPNWVWGLESDLLWSGIKESDPIAEVKVEWLGSVRARLGIASPTAMLYATGGLGIGNGKASALGFSDSNTHTGWVAGGGIEWKAGPNWSAKIEYLHYDFGRENYFGLLPLSYEVDTVKFGVNYSFGH